MTSDTDALYVGVDIGGTNISAALVDESGDVVERARRRTPRRGGSDEAVEAILLAVQDLLEKGEIESAAVSAIGVGVAGPVEAAKGVVVRTVNMNLSGTQLVAPIEDRFGVPAALGNDVDVGTLGEWWLGAARGADSVVGIFIGTGIGGGVVVHGRLVRGAREAGGEVGHMIMSIGGPLCNCGNRGCYEALASRTAIERDIREAVEAGRKTVLTELLKGDFPHLRSGALKKALQEGDELTIEVLRRAFEITGYACLNIQHVLDPEVIVIGGGVVEACGSFAMPIIEEVVHGDPFLGDRPGSRVVKSALGDDAGVLGAVAIAMERIGRTPATDSGAPAGTYPTIQGVRFGEVTVEGETFSTDIVIRVDGTVKKRKKKIAKEQYGSSHVIGAEELRRLCKGGLEVLIVGTGHSGAAGLAEDCAAFLEGKGIRVEAVPTAEAAELYNKAEGRKAAIIHVTC